MDYQFPQRLFPCFYNNGPPSASVQSSAEAGGWGCYRGVLPQRSSGSVPSWTFMSKHQVRGDTWNPTEPVVIPLLSPKEAFLCNLKPPDPLDFTEHMQHFYLNYGHDAFGCMSDLIGEHFYFRYRKNYKERHRRGSVNMWTVKNLIEKMKYKMCHQMFGSASLGSYCGLLCDVAPDIPAELLGSLLYEELTEQRDRLSFSERSTGGALAFVPFSQSRGCLVYPGGPGLDRLNFHRAALQQCEVELSSRAPHSFQLEAPVRQISHSCLFNDCCVAVRSDYCCGVWRLGDANEPRLLQVVRTSEAATCVSVSPQVLGEVLVASESGAVNLWTVGRSLQKVRVEDANLYFNAKSCWRWCEFSAHPRVILYADRTGVELTDVRGAPGSGLTLFWISSTSECRSGERLLQSRYLGHAHSFHHLVATQHSAYVMDERFPCVPMLKWDHMMKAPPLFCHVIPRSAGREPTGVLLGSQSSQEVTLLQYSGGRAEPCFSLGPPQALLRPRDSLGLLPVQIPRRQEIAAERLGAPAAGLTCVWRETGSELGGGDGACVLQLTEAGDVFYQVLQLNGAPAAEERPGLERLLVVSDTQSEDEVIGPTQVTVVPETPERQQNLDSDSSEDSGGRSFRLAQLQVFVNDDPDTAPVDGGGAKGAEEKEDEGGKGSGSRKRAPAALSGRTLHTWKVWLQKLMQRSGEKKLDSQLLTAETEDLLKLPEGGTRGAVEEKRLRRELRACMSSRSLLLRGSASDPAPVPDAVDTKAWRDVLSERLTASWEGEEAWRAWWHERLGMNRKSKTEALRRKRRREKEARRAAGRLPELSGSFTSSVSYQAELDDFSSSAGWSSAVSQGAWSDADDGRAAARLESPGSSTPSNILTDAPGPTQTQTPTAQKDKDQQAPSLTKLPETPQSSLWRTRHPLRDFMSSLFETQDDPSQNDASPRAADSRLLRSSDVPSSMASSRTLSASGASQGRRGASQSQKKRPRMGF